MLLVGGGHESIGNAGARTLLPKVFGHGDVTIPGGVGEEADLMSADIMDFLGVGREDFLEGGEVAEGGGCGNIEGGT